MTLFDAVTARSREAFAPFASSPKPVTVYVVTIPGSDGGAGPTERYVALYPAPDARSAQAWDGVYRERRVWWQATFVAATYQEANVLVDRYDTALLGWVPDVAGFVAGPVEPEDQDTTAAASVFSWDTSASSRKVVTVAKRYQFIAAQA